MTSKPYEGLVGVRPGRKGTAPSVLEGDPSMQMDAPLPLEEATARFLQESPHP